MPVRTREGCLLADHNLVIITLDCVRPDFLGCYGCQTVRTPTLDRMASRGAVFEVALSQAPNTWVSHAGIMTGLYPPCHGLRTPYDQLSPDVATLASFLSNHGYCSAGFPGNDLVGSRAGFHRGFDLFFEQYRAANADPSDSPGKQQPPAAHTGPETLSASPDRITANNRNPWEEVVKAADDWLSQQIDPVFMWFHYLDTHHLPECDLPDYYRFSRDPLWQYYEGKISYADERCVLAVLDLLHRHGRYDRTLVAVLSDHGEGLRPGMPPVHNDDLTEEVLRVPLILFDEALPCKGFRTPSLVRTADLFPTLAGLVCENTPEVAERLEPLSGVTMPLPGVTEAGLVSGGRTDLAYAENKPLDQFCLRSSEWKYLTGPSGESLFHILSDPREQTNAVFRHPETAAYLKNELETIRSSRQSTKRVPVDREEEETRRLLRSLGYL